MSVSESLPLRIGKYDIQSEIGHGRLVRVFRAYDHDLERPVTLKLLTESADPDVTRRFRSELACVSKLRTGSIIGIYEMGDHLGLPFAAMQVLGDADLKQAMSVKSPLDLLQKMLIFWRVAEGLQDANLAGLRHVGLTPSGIALDDSGRATIQDFGMVRLSPEMESEAALYAAPEESAGAFPPDSLCDIFALGTICYELLTGIHPFASDKSERPPALREFAPECPEELERLVHRAIEEPRAARYQSLEELQDDGEPILRELKQKRSNELLANARLLIDGQELEKALPILRDVLQIDPENDSAHRMRSDVRAALNARMARLQAKLTEARSLILTKRFNAAIVALAELSTEFSGDPQVSELLEEACRARDRAEAIVQVEARCHQFRREGQFEKALETLDGALATYSGEPSLTTLRQELNEQWQELKSSVEVDKALAEAQWLIDQGRPDLAIQFLRQKAEELPAHLKHQELRSRLAEIEQTLPEWERLRFIEDALRRMAALEQLQQSAVALTVIEEALEKYPDARDLLDSAARIRCDLTEQERGKKLARRLDAIRQKIGSQEWSHALSAIEAARTDFPAEPQLDLLWQTAEEGRRRSVSDAITIEVRQLLADGELEHAEEVLRRGWESLPADAGLLALQQELEAERKYREEWHTAQVLYGRCQFQKAEEILVRLVSSQHPEVELLLAKVRESHKTSEQQAFYDERREKALQLARQHEFEKAADLLNHLLILFPGDAILERDLQAVQAVRQDRAASEVFSPPPAFMPAPLPQAVPMVHREELAVPVPIPGHSRWALIAVSGFLLLATSSAAVWKLSRGSSAGAQPVKPVVVQPAVAVPIRVPTEVPAAPSGAPIGDHVVPARLISAPPPVLPALARQQKIAGTVNLEGTVDKAGKVKSVRVISGHHLLSGAALNAVLKWRYRPATLDGQPIESKVKIEVLFVGDWE